MGGKLPSYHKDGTFKQYKRAQTVGRWKVDLGRCHRRARRWDRGDGLDKERELIVNRQPRFNHIGSSTPKLIIMKLSKAARKKNIKALYDDVLNSLEGEKIPVQTPLILPWITEGLE